MNMRSILHASVLALFAGTAYAQSLPDPIASGNLSYIDQIGSTQTATADQQVMDGSSGNYSGIYQGNLSASSNNNATVQQRASGGALNGALTIQNGAHNTAKTQQYTAKTAATPGGTVIFTVPFFTFTTNAAGGTATYGGTTLPTSFAGGTFTSTIDQHGDYNQAYVHQGFWGSAAVTGVNYSDVAQSGSNAYVDLKQYGATNNWSSVEQNGIAVNRASDITQQGLSGSNVSTLIQAGGATSPYILQTANGGSNASYMNQTGGRTSLSQTANTGANNSGVYEVGGTASIYQSTAAPSGSNNSLIWQYGGKVVVDQSVLASGGTNTSNVTQTGASSGASTSYVYQTASAGFTNLSNLIQTGDNYAYVTQEQGVVGGGNNTSTITQTNTGAIENQAILSQTANYGANTSTIIQTGYGNIAKVTQR